MDKEPTVKVGLIYLPSSFYHALHSQFTILWPSQSVPLEPVICVLKISQSSWHSVFQKQSLPALQSPRCYIPEMSQSPKYPNPGISRSLVPKLTQITI